jgi:hypothetical protein
VIAAADRLLAVLVEVGVDLVVRVRFKLGTREDDEVGVEVEVEGDARCDVGVDVRDDDVREVGVRVRNAGVVVGVRVDGDATRAGCVMVAALPPEIGVAIVALVLLEGDVVDEPTGVVGDDDEAAVVEALAREVAESSVVGGCAAGAVRPA